MRKTLLAIGAAAIVCAALFRVEFVESTEPVAVPPQPEKAIMMGYVEDFFNNNFRDVTMRKSLEWGEVQTDDKGNRTIRYKYEALIWDKERMILCGDFTFDKEGNFVKQERVGEPQPVGKPDVTTLEGVQKLVEKFFSQNFRDITARKTVSWGELEKHEDGSVSLVYRHEATIWDKDVIVDERRFTFDKDGNVKSWERTEGFPQPVNAVERPDHLAGTPGDSKEEIVTSLEKFLQIEGLTRYPVNKRIADFPADKIDLSTPEASYATQKNLIVSNRPDKMEQLLNMTQGRPPIPDRERRAMSQEISADWAKTYREKFDVFEVFVLEDKYAFVFGLRRFDMLYDGNYFIKDGNEWLNKGNEQSFRAEEIAASAQRFLSQYQQQAERIRSYTVGKKVTDYPAGAIDMLTPETAYALGNRIIGDDNPDKIERLRHYTAGMSVPKHMEEWITNMPPEDRVLMMNAEILHVFDYRDKHAMVIAEVVKGEKYSNRLFSKRDGHWFNTGGGGFYKGSSAEEVVKMNEGAFTKLADGWDKAMQNPGTAQSTAPSPALLDSEIDPKRVPKIVKMFPENGAKDVDPNISQVYLTFDIPMGSGRAWASNNADGTTLDHDPDQAVFWTADGLTCVAPVKLQPNKRYVVYLNVRPFIGFASIAGVPSEGLTYSFETGSTPLDSQRREELAKGAFGVPAALTKGRAWSPEQATGEPDAWLFKTGGDYTQVWASLTPDGQEEWLTLTWNKPVEAVGVDVYETFNPGALVRVVAYNDDTEVARWEGIDPTPRNVPNGKGISKIRFEKPVKANRMTLYLDSPNVPGWNEIDAVGLIGASGAVHWATGATASSTYAENGKQEPAAVQTTEPTAAPL